MELERWGDFAVAMVGAGAVLAGFVFLALSVNLDRVLGAPGVTARAGETLIVFTGVLVVAAVLLVPGQGRNAVAIELVLVGLGEGAVLLRLLPRGRRGAQPRAWAVTRAVTAAVVSGPVVLAGVLVGLGVDGGLYLVAAALLLAVVAGIANTWVLAVEVVRDERYRPPPAD